jgi:hypothetical protein
MKTEWPLYATALQMVSPRPALKRCGRFRSNEKWIACDNFGRIMVNVQPFGICHAAGSVNAARHKATPRAAKH